MLGLGNSIITSSEIKQPFFSYYSDFTSGVDGWADAGSTEGGTISLAANQTIAGESGWLKCTYPANQTNQSGIKSSDLMDGLTAAVGDYGIMRGIIYLYHDGSTDHWEGTDVVQVYPFTGSAWEALSATNQDIPLNTVKDINLKFGPDTDGSWSTNIEIWFNDNNDNPQSGAVFYIRDISVQLFRAG